MKFASVAAAPAHSTRRASAGEPFLTQGRDALYRRGRLPAMLTFVDAEQRYLYSNEPYLRLFGLEREQIVSHHTKDVLGDDIYRAILPHITQSSGIGVALATRTDGSGEDVVAFADAALYEAKGQGAIASCCRRWPEMRQRNYSGAPVLAYLSTRYPETLLA